MTDKQGVVHTQSGTSFSLKEGGNPDPGFKVDGLWGHGAQRNEPDTEGQIYTAPLMCGPSRRLFVGTETRRVGSGAGGGGVMLVA